MSDEKFSSKASVIAMVQHYETLLVYTKMMESEHPFVADALAEIAKVKEHFTNRCFLTRRLTDELLSRDLLSEDNIELEEGEDGE